MEEPGRLVTSPVMLLALVGQAARERVEAALGERGLSLRYVGVLGHLDASPTLSYSDLARRAGVTVQSMQATVASMVEHGWVAQSGPGGRGRPASLSLTDAGRTALTDAATVVAEVESEFLAGVSAEARAGLAAALGPLALGVLGARPQK